jgi:hypothetical protein
MEELNIAEKLEKANLMLDYCKSETYFENLIGTIGADPLFRK